MLPKIDVEIDELTATRTEELYHQHRESIFKSIDRLFAWLMLVQWIAGIALAVWISPKTWSGEFSNTHLHVWCAVFLGGLISLFPCGLALARPGWVVTRMVIAIGQTLMSALLIHLSGGRIETHFHVFGSLVILSFYRDWRVLIPATVVVAADHFVRGVYWPQSVYGVLVAEPWRWLEHAGWVLFEDVFLFMSCLRSQKEMWFVARRTAQLENTNKIVEDKVIHISREVNERKQAESALKEAKEEAERANGAKSEFLSRMSHELRTPMNAIIGFAQLLEMDCQTAQQRESVTHILKGGRHLLLLINEVLDIAHIESGRISLSSEPVRLNDVVQETLDLVRPLAAQRKVQLRGTPLQAGAGYVFADRQRLKQVLLNLLSNAVKYNRVGGTVTLSCSENPGAESQNGRTKHSRLRLMVSDSGNGIPPEKLSRLFSPFDRLDAEQGPVEGTGLGLALSKRLIEAMGGTMGVQSVLGEGCVFWVELAQVDASTDGLDPLQNDVVSDIVRADLPTRNVLYIEDNLSNLRLIEGILTHRPRIKLMSAMQGGLGIDLAREHRPDLILLDINLPDIPGTEVLAQLRKDARTLSIPVVVISADAMIGQTERLMAAGARAYLTKPIDVHKFLEVLDTTLQTNSQAAGKVPRTDERLLAA